MVNNLSTMSMPAIYFLFLLYEIDNECSQREGTGIESVTSRTLRENHTTRPASLDIARPSNIN